MTPQQSGFVTAGHYEPDVPLGRSDDGAQELARGASAVIEGRGLAPAAAVNALPYLAGVADCNAPSSIAELERMG